MSQADKEVQSLRKHEQKVKVFRKLKCVIGEAIARSRQGRALWSINHSVFGVCFIHTPHVNELLTLKTVTDVRVGCARRVYVFDSQTAFFFGAVPTRLMCLSSV